MLQPQPVGSIPDDTLLASKAAIPGGNTCTKLHDHLVTIFQDSLFESTMIVGLIGASSCTFAISPNSFERTTKDERRMGPH
jgi:hypothetical protein